jgi:hypothetical protein
MEVILNMSIVKDIFNIPNILGVGPITAVRSVVNILMDLFIFEFYTCMLTPRPGLSRLWPTDRIWPASVINKCFKELCFILYFCIHILKTVQISHCQ